MSKRKRHPRKNVPYRDFHVRVEMQDDSGDWGRYAIKTRHTFSEDEAIKLVMARFRDTSKVRVMAVSDNPDDVML